MNSKLDEIKGFGINNSLADVCDKIDSLGAEIKWARLYNSLSDVCDKIESLETTVTMGENY